MPHSSKYDVVQAPDFRALGYDALTKGLDPNPRFVSGSQDLYVAPNGGLKKRPAVQDSDLGTHINTPQAQSQPSTCHRLWVYETLENPPKVYVLGSFKMPAGGVASRYDMYYMRLGTTSNWTQLGTTRSMDSSAKPHEVVISNGLAYIKSFPQDNASLAVDLESTGNYGFELGALTNWSVTGTGSTDAASGALPRTGSWGMQSTYASASNGGRALTVSSAAASFPAIGETVTVNAYVWITSGSPTAKLKAQFAGGSPVEVTTTTTGSWVNLNLDIVNDQGAADLTISLIGDGTGVAYWDDMTINTKERLGTTVFDGSDASLKIWGTLGPSAAAVRNGLPASWSATAGTTTVNFGWLYSYSYVTETGQISNRAAFDPPAGQGELSDSNTGAFTSKIPEITVTGDGDTTGLPTIQMWRSLDGGGVFPALETLANPGATTTTYLDDSGGAGAGDPVTDFELDTANLAPSLTSNSPPPAAIYPGVTGTDPIEASTAPVEYAGRLWYSIGNILYFSGLEEILNGIPQESWPSGLKGNFIRFKNPIRYLIPTNEALYIVTNSNVLWIRGFDRASFRVAPLFEQLGGLPDQNRAWTAVRNVAAFVTEDGQVALVRGEQVEIISGPLADELTDILNSGDEVHIRLASHFRQGQAFLLVGVYNVDTTANSRIFVYDIGRQRWNPPWVIPFSEFVSGRIRASDSKRELLIAIDEGTSNQSIALLDFDQYTDELPSGDADFAPTVTFNLTPPPGGNHLNLLRVPAAFPNLQKVKIERTKFATDTDPTISIRLDDFDTASFETLTAAPPDLLAQRTSYHSLWAPVDKAAQRAQIKVTAASEAKDFELQTVGLLWQPGAGS